MAWSADVCLSWLLFALLKEEGKQRPHTNENRGILSWHVAEIPIFFIVTYTKTID